MDKVPEGPWQKAGVIVAVVGVLVAAYFGFKSLGSSSHPVAPSTDHSTATSPGSGSSGGGGSSGGSKAYLSGLQPGSTVTGDLKVGAQQINGKTYQNSVRFACGAGWAISYWARGYKVLTATVGVPDDNSSVAAGATVTVSFADQIGTSAASSTTVTPGHPQDVTVNLPGSVQGGESPIDISCSVSPSLTDGVEVALGNAALSNS